MGRNQKVTDQQIANAIVAARGIKAGVARKLGISRPALIERIQQSEELTNLCHEQKQILLDTAEHGLALAVKKRAAWAIKFILSTLGRERGYTKTLNVESNHTGGQVILYLPENGRERPEIPDELKKPGINLIMPDDGRDTSTQPEVQNEQA